MVRFFVNKKNSISLRPQCSWTKFNHQLNKVVMGQPLHRHQIGNYSIPSHVISDFASLS